MDLKKLLLGRPNQAASYYISGSTEAWHPVEDIKDGVIHTKDGRYVRIMEILPVNFALKSPMEQQNMIFSYASYLKISPNNLQITVLTQKADIGAYEARMRGYLETEENAQCRAAIHDNIAQVRHLASSRALTKRIFLTIELEPSMGVSGDDPSAISERLRQEEQTARRYLSMCGLEVLVPNYADNFQIELLYKLLNPRAAALPLNVFDAVGDVVGGYEDTAEAPPPEPQNSSDLPASAETDLEEPDANEQRPAESPAGWMVGAIDKIPRRRRKNRPKPQDTPKQEKARRIGRRRKTYAEQEPAVQKAVLRVADILAPASVSTKEKSYVEVDGVCFAYLYITGYGYDTAVGRGWMTPLLEAGEGVNVTFFLRRQRKERILSKISQTTRFNRSRMRDIGDTRQDFEELGDAIESGLWIKSELNRNNEDFYFLHTLIEISAPDAQILAERVAQVQTMCTAMDLITKRCDYQHGNAYLSSLPLLSMDPSIERKSRRNILTSSLAAGFPFGSFEICDQSGILLGLNLQNQSLCMIDPFNSTKYENANFSIMGMTGAGKTMLLQLLATRFYEQQVPVCVIAPFKGHEYRPACEAMGGKYVKLAPSSSDCINIMEIRGGSLDPEANIGRMEARNDSLLANKITTMHIFFSPLIPNISDEDKNLLDAGLLRCYQAFGISYDNDSLYDADGNLKAMPTLKDLYETLSAHEDTRHLAVYLTRYVSGSASSMGGSTNVNLEAGYIVLDISDAPPDLLVNYILVCLDFFWGHCKVTPLLKKVLIVDELWRLIGSSSNALVANYVLEIVKLIRAMGGSFINATQDLVDYFSLDGGKYGKAVLNASRFKIVLPLEEEEARLVQDKLHLSDEETMQIVRSNRGEGLLCAGHNRIPIAVQPSQKEYDLITTSREDLILQARKSKARKAE